MVIVEATALDHKRDQNQELAEMGAPITNGRITGYFQEITNAHAPDST